LKFIVFVAVSKRKVKPLSNKTELHFLEGPMSVEGDETEQFIDFVAARSVSTHPFKYAQH
jgi:hypothetical protein